MSVNMPHLHSLFASLLDGGQDGPGPHTILLLSITGAVVISASTMPAQTRQRTVITIAAVAVETWNSMLELQELDKDPKKDSIENGEDKAIGGWATVEFGNVFVCSIPRPDKTEQPLFLIAVSGAEEIDLDLLEERAKMLAEHLSPIFAGYTDPASPTSAKHRR